MTTVPVAPRHGPPLHLLYRALVVEALACAAWAAADFWRHRRDFG